MSAPSALHAAPSATVAQAASSTWPDYLRRIGQGDQAALTALHAETRAHVFMVAYRALGRHADAEEVALDVYLQVWRSAHRYDVARGSVLAWLTTIARSRALDRRRQLVRRDGPATALVDVPEMRTSTPDPEQRLLIRSRRHRVGAAVRALPARQRRSIRLAFVEECTHREAAARQRIPLGTVKTRIRDGLRRMSPMLAGSV